MLLDIETLYLLRKLSPHYFLNTLEAVDCLSINWKSRETNMELVQL